MNIQSIINKLFTEGTPTNGYQAITGEPYVSTWQNEGYPPLSMPFKWLAFLYWWVGFVIYVWYMTHFKDLNQYRVYWRKQPTLEKNFNIENFDSDKKLGKKIFRGYVIYGRLLISRRKESTLENPGYAI